MEAPVDFERYKAGKTLDWSADKLNNDHVAEMEKYNKYDALHRKEHFDSIANNYEGLYLRVGYPDPQKVADKVEKYCTGKDKSKIKILDFACGSGLVGKKLKAKGFTNIVGIDCSPKMLAEARLSGVYSELQTLTLGDANRFPVSLMN